MIKHEVLLIKLESYSVKESELQSFNGYLFDRLQHVVYNNPNSDPRRLSFDAVQGSILGPMLFKIHINSLSKACHTSSLSLHPNNTVKQCNSKNVDLAVYSFNKDLKGVSLIL